MIVSSLDIFRLYEGSILDDNDQSVFSRNDVFDIGKIRIFGTYTCGNNSGGDSVMLIFKGDIIGSNVPVTILIPLFIFDKKSSISTITKQKQKHGFYFKNDIITFIDKYPTSSMLSYHDVNALIRANKFIFGVIWKEWVAQTGYIVTGFKNE